MKFDVSCVRNHFLKHRMVYTVRSYLYKSNKATFEGREIVRLYEGEVKSKGDLVNWVNQSGFKTIDEWWTAIERFCKNKKKYLYFVHFREGRIVEEK